MADEKQALSKKLVRIIRAMEKLEAADRDTREKLLRCMADAETVVVDGMEVAKRIVHKTITDPKELMERGFDISRVTVTKTSIDPALVARIGEEEKRPYYTQKPTIVCRKAKQQ